MIATGRKAPERKALNPPPLRLIIFGVPQPQGSHRIARVGLRFAIVDSNIRLRPWRAMVTGWARSQKDPGIFEGPVTLDLDFTLARPKSIPKSRRYPDKRPDLSKLFRAVEDSLTVARVWYDDGQVVHSEQWKRYVGDPDALDRPGVVITVRSA